MPGIAYCFDCDMFVAVYVALRCVWPQLWRWLPFLMYFKQCTCTWLMRCQTLGFRPPYLYSFLVSWASSWQNWRTRFSSNTSVRELLPMLVMNREPQNVARLRLDRSWESVTKFVDVTVCGLTLGYSGVATHLSCACLIFKWLLWDDNKSPPLLGL